MQSTFSDGKSGFEFWFTLLFPGIDKGRDGTVPRFFVPVPQVLRDNHAGQSRENLSRRFLSRSRLSRGFE